jgi:hypothetical protein
MRFVWMYKYASQSNNAADADKPHVVLDTEPPGGEPGQVTVFAECQDRAAAVMTCMALNGQG